MAVKPHKAKTRKSQQIEPLDWSAMAQSPALKGMVSFLEVTPEDIRRQRDADSESRIGSDAQTGSDSHTGSDAHTGSIPRVATGQHHSGRDASLNGRETAGESPTVREAYTGSDTRTGSESHTAHAPRPLSKELENCQTDEAFGMDGLPDRESGIASDELVNGSKAAISHLTLREQTAAPRSQRVSASHFVSDSSTGNEPRIGSYADTGSDTRTGSVSQLDSEAPDRTDQLTASSAQANSGVSESRTGSASLTGVTHHRHPDVAYPGQEDTDSYQSARPPQESVDQIPVSETRIGAAASKYASGDPYARPARRMPMIQGEVVWQNRRIRKCVLAQDAHSQGEDALFSAMWSAAKPDPRDPSGSRMIRIGYAELAQKSRMHRSNVRINIAGLRAKLAIEVLDEHDSRDVTPRTYRLYSFKEILERRRVAGLEYVIRKKSVIFVTETGEVLPLPGLPKASVRKPRNSDSIGSAAVSRFTNHEASPEQMDLDVRQISDALSQHWAVDEAAAHQLLRQCRGVRRDAEIDEIIFFVNEKLHIALTNKNIKNPTGLVLATVPQCFEGETFLEFRRRRNEVLRHTAEEEERKRQQEREMEQWLARQIDTLRATAADHTQPESLRSKAERELKLYGG